MIQSISEKSYTTQGKLSLDSHLELLIMNNYNSVDHNIYIKLQSK